MTDENKFDAQSRRKFLKTTGAVGVAATTGVAAFGGQAAAQQNITVDASDIVNVGDDLITVILNDVEIVSVEDVTVTIKNIDIDVTAVVKDITANVLTIDISDVNVNALNKNQIIVQVAVLGTNAAGQTVRRRGTDVVRLS